jgi:PAS domain S-box-containing protein
MDDGARTARSSTSVADAVVPSVIRQVPAVIWVVDLDLRFTLSDGGGLGAIGSAPGETVGQTLFEYFGTEDRTFPPIAAHLRALGGESSTYELWWRSRSFHSRVEPLRDEQGRITGVLGFAIDITERKLMEQELENAESKYRTLVEQVPAIVYLSLYGEEGDWLYVSPQIEHVLGYTATEWLLHPHPMASFTHPEDLPAVRAEEARSQREADTYRIEYRMRSKDGRWVWIRDEATAVPDASGTPVLMQGLMFNTTESRRAEEQLRRANRALRMISESNQALLRASDESTLLADVCQKVVEIGEYRLAWVGYAEHDQGKSVRPVAQAGFEDGYLEGLDITWADRLRGRDPTGTAIRMQRPVAARNIAEDPAYGPWREDALRRGYASSCALPLLIGDACIGTLNVYSSEPEAFDEQELDLLSDLAGDLAFGISALRAREERHHAEEQLRRTVDALRKTDRVRRELLSRLVTAQEEERRTIASDIHDDTIQALTIVGIRLGVVERQVTDPGQLEALKVLQGSVEAAIKRLRSLMFELRPPALEGEGLAAAIRGYLDRVVTDAGFDYRLDNQLEDEPPVEVRAVVYRIVQEAIANVRKHAQAENLEITLQSRRGGILARIRDDGSGFDIEEALERGAEHMGLSSMRERAEMAGGWCRVSGALGAGTVVEVWVPSRLTA